MKITDPEVVRISGSGEHPMLQVSEDSNDYVDGMVFEITDEELSAADAYEDRSYVRVSVTLSSGVRCWAYLPAGTRQD